MLGFHFIHELKGANVLQESHPLLKYFSLVLSTADSEGLQAKVPVACRQGADFAEPPTAAKVATGSTNVATRWLGWPGIAQVCLLHNSAAPKTVQKL
uniref:Uncharacterized protein n=1 Tax=Romanomermis culicivorax TaxID=13658 RepID=A0A915JIX0_ROMCU